MSPKGSPVCSEHRGFQAVMVVREDTIKVDTDSFHRRFTRFRNWPLPSLGFANLTSFANFISAASNIKISPGIKL